VTETSHRESSGSSEYQSTSPKLALGPIRQSYSLVVAGQHGRWIGLVAMAVVVSAFETVGAGLIFVLIALVSAPDGAIELPLIGDVSRYLPDVPTETLLVGAGIAVGVFFLARGMLQVVMTYAQHRIAFNAGARLGVKLVRGYMAMPYPYHLRHESSGLVRNAITSVQEIINSVVIPASNFVAEVLIVAGLTLLLLATAPLPTLLVLAIIAPAVYLVLRLVRTRVRRYGQIAVDSSKNMISNLQQSLHGIRDIKLLRRERHFLRGFRGERIRDANARAKRATLAQLSYVLVDTILMTSIVAFLIITVTVGGTASESFAVLGLFAYVGMRLKPSIQKIIVTANNLRFASPAIDDLHHDLEETREFADRWNRHEGTDRKIPELERSIALQSVTFQYEGAHRPALESVDLEIAKGESLGICGPTGGGKSTLVDLIAGLLEPSSGRVTVDGVDITADPRDWYRQLGVVSQNIYMFDDSLRNNIALGVAESEVDEDALSAAVEAAQLTDFVNTLPMGLRTNVGEHGTLLSGGQRQRVAIARALYQGAKVLILDEGTSALDNETERNFMSALASLRGDHTIIIVAHRLTTIESCDRVIFVSDGRLNGGGTFEELYAENAEFRRMAS
jgi:ATP-binding cassette, subfamily B, bacterial PglK